MKWIIKKAAAKWISMIQNGWIVGEKESVPLIEYYFDSVYIRQTKSKKNFSAKVGSERQWGAVVKKEFSGIWAQSKFSVSVNL